MGTEFEILLNNQKSLCTSDVPESLGDHFMLGTQAFHALKDARADILCQHVRTDSFAIEIINLYVREKLKVIIRDHSAKTFFATNTGPDVRCAFGDTECQNFKNNFYNIFYLPEFSITLYPKAAEKHYELFLIEIKDKQALFDIERFKNDFFNEYKSQN